MPIFTWLASAASIAREPSSKRKFLLSFATVASATALVYVGAIADGVYSAVVIATVGGYLTANVAQKAVVKPDKE